MIHSVNFLLASGSSLSSGMHGPGLHRWLPWPAGQPADKSVCINCSACDRRRKAWTVNKMCLEASGKLIIYIYAVYEDISSLEMQPKNPPLFWTLFARCAFGARRKSTRVPWVDSGEFETLWCDYTLQNIFRLHSREENRITLKQINGYIYIYIHICTSILRNTSVCTRILWCFVCFLL